MKDNVTVWECPDLFPLKLMLSSVEKWVLVVNVNPGGYQAGSGARYFIGQFDGFTFVADDAKRVDFVDYGSDFYAVTSFFDMNNDLLKRTALGWMSNWVYSSKIPTAPWRGQMSFPRDYTLGEYKGEYYL